MKIDLKVNEKKANQLVMAAGDLIEQSIGVGVAGGRRQAPVLDKEPEEKVWYRLPLAKGLSGDGSDYYVYLKKGSANKLCLFFSGGGVAWDSYTASHPSTGGRIAAGEPHFYWNNLRPFTQIMNINMGITETRKDRNPFDDWSFLVITYTTGDFHLGSGKLEYGTEEGRKETLHFHGYSNFREAMKKARHYFPDPDRLLIAGDSAGAFAVPALAPLIMNYDYRKCPRITLLSDSGLLYRTQWKKTMQEVWKVRDWITRDIHTQNPVADWFESIARNGDQRVDCLYASSVYDHLLSSYYNEVLTGKFEADDYVMKQFHYQLMEMHRRLKSCGLPFHFFFYDFKQPLAPEGGTVHTAIRQPWFYLKTQEGVSMAQWLDDFMKGNVYNVGENLL